MSEVQPSPKASDKTVPGPGPTTPDIPGVKDPDLETGGSTKSKFGEFEDEKIRNKFIAKVYSILSAQLLISSGLILLCLLTPGACKWIKNNPAYTFASYGVFMFIYLVLAPSKSVRRKVPGNIVALVVFTVAFTYMASGVTCAYSTVGLLAAVGVTAICCLIITFIAVFGCVNFAKCKAVFIIMIVALVVMGGSCVGVCLAFGIDKTSHAIYGALAAFIFTIYLVCDTLLLMGGQRTEISPKEYIFGALQLYLDVFTLLFTVRKIRRCRK